MDSEDLRRLLRASGADLWEMLDAAITVAASDHGPELRARRDAIVERLYASPLPPPPSEPAAADRSRNPEPRNGTTGPPMRREDGAKKPAAMTPSPESMDRSEEEGEEEDPESRGRALPLEVAGDEESNVLAIKELLEDPDQSEDSLVNLLQNLADMDITFKALKETDIGRHVNGLRKHPSSEVRRLVKIVVRKWKDTVDEWVMSNSDAASPAVITDGDSPQQLPGKNHHQNGHFQVRELGHSPNPNNSLSSERNGLEPAKAKAPVIAPRREATPTNKPNNINHTVPSSAMPVKVKEQKEMLLEERLASAKKRLHENYQEAENAKKQRTIQVMDIHEIPKGKNSSFVRKGGSQAKHW